MCELAAQARHKISVLYSVCRCRAPLDAAKSTSNAPPVPFTCAIRPQTVCAAGYGGKPCAICGYGQWSKGGTTAACSRCAPANFTTLVKGAQNASLCTGEWPGPPLHSDRGHCTRF